MEFKGISRETLVALHETEGIGWKTIAELWEARKDRPVREGMRSADLRDCGLKPKAAAAAAVSLSPERMEASLERRMRAGIEVVTWADETYPRMLRQISDPPVVLYCKGRMELLNRPSIGVVGTRMATAYGRHVAEAYSAVFAGRGLTVVSGMARGIDTCAHRGALEGEGSTIAVLGLPVEQIYPPDNRQLYHAIAERGLLVSEAPPGTRYHSGMFPSRNRIISGLSLGVVIAEAPADSGALITADYAIAADRPVFAVPGPVTSPRCRGGLQMIREGTASMLLEPEDALKQFGSHVRSAERSYVSDTAETGMTPEAILVYELILDAPRSVDELAEETAMPLGQLNGLLLKLLMDRKIRQMPGSLYETL